MYSKLAISIRCSTFPSLVLTLLHNIRALPQGLQTWADRVRSLRQLLNTGLDVSDERYHRMYSTGVNLPSDRQYYVDSSGEIYYDAGYQAKLRAGSEVQAVRK